MACGQVCQGPPVLAGQPPQGRDCSRRPEASQRPLVRPGQGLQDHRLWPLLQCGGG